MPPKIETARSGKGDAAAAADEFESLTEEEVIFAWKGLVDAGQLSATKLEKFMLEVTGETMSPMQIRDLMIYMDANGDGRVGMEDFKNFMSIGRLSQTNPANFMWTPKANYREEHPAFREEPSSPQHGDNGHNSASGAAPGPLAAAAPAVAGAASATATASTSTALSKPKTKPVAITDKTRARINASVEKHEQQCWERFEKEEQDIQRKIFDQFAKTERDALTVTEYHKMLMKWHKLARWCMPSDMRPADSLATLEYVTRRDLEAKKITAVAAGEPIPSLSPQGEAKLGYQIWLDIMNGKHRPEEHLQHDKSASVEVSDVGGKGASLRSSVLSKPGGPRNSAAGLAAQGKAGRPP